MTVETYLNHRGISKGLVYNTLSTISLEINILVEVFEFWIQKFRSLSSMFYCSTYVDISVISSTINRFLKQLIVLNIQFIIYDLASYNVVVK